MLRAFTDPVSSHLGVVSGQVFMPIKVDQRNSELYYQLRNELLIICLRAGIFLETIYLRKWSDTEFWPGTESVTVLVVSFLVSDLFQILFYASKDLVRHDVVEFRSFCYSCPNFCSATKLSYAVT